MCGRSRSVPSLSTLVVYLHETFLPKTLQSRTRLHDAHDILAIMATITDFAKYYETGKYADLAIVLKPENTLHVHRLVVCSQSPVLDAQAANNASVIRVDEDEAVFTQMIEWMYGIDNKNLLIDARRIDQVVLMGQNVVYGELATMAELAVVAEKVPSYLTDIHVHLLTTMSYCVAALKDQAMQHIQTLVASLTSPHSVLRAIQFLAPEGIRGLIHKALTSRAFEFVLADNMLTSQSTIGNCLTPATRTISNNSTAAAADEGKREININKSALRSARRAAVQQPHEDDDSSSDSKPLINRKRKRQDNQPSLITVLKYKRVPELLLERTFCLAADMNPSTTKPPFYPPEPKGNNTKGHQRHQ